MIILEIEMEMFSLTVMNQISSLKLFKTKDKDNSIQPHRFSHLTCLRIIYNHIAGNDFRNHPSQRLYFTDNKTEAEGYY